MGKLYSELVHERAPSAVAQSAFLVMVPVPREPERCLSTCRRGCRHFADQQRFPWDTTTCFSRSAFIIKMPHSYRNVTTDCPICHGWRHCTLNKGSPRSEENLARSVKHMLHAPPIDSINIFTSGWLGLTFIANQLHQRSNMPAECRYCSLQFTTVSYSLYSPR